MKRLREYSLKTRGIQEAKSLTPPRFKRYDFTRNKQEMAYLIGFRLGDLYISKTHPRSPTIRISTNTTRPEQIALVKRLFSPYGHITVSGRDRRGARSIRCFVNNSFNFLLKKDGRIEQWIQESKMYFVQFLAGYIDAEGSFIAKQNKVFSVQSQDRYILEAIEKNLNKFGISCPQSRLVRKSGTVNNGIRSNKDVWSIQIYRKDTLQGLIGLVGRYIRHGKRRRDMNFLLKQLNYVGT